MFLLITNSSYFGVIFFVTMMRLAMFFFLALKEKKKSEMFCRLLHQQKIWKKIKKIFFLIQWSVKSKIPTKINQISSWYTNIL